MTPLIALVLVAAAHETAADTAPAGAASPSDWSITIGGGVLANPSYPGAASSRVTPLPFFEIRYRDLAFLSPVSGVGIHVVATRRVMAGVAVSPDLGRTASAGDRLRGWGDIGAGANLKLFGMYSLGPVALLANVRRQLGVGNGTLIDGGVTSTLPVARFLVLTATATITWADGKYARAYFGIDTNQSAEASAQGASVPVYSARAGPRDATLAFVAVVPVDDHWSVQSLVRAELLLGDAASSPLTESRVQPMFGGFITYRM